jgi:hypothetical protein
MQREATKLISKIEFKVTQRGAYVIIFVGDEVAVSTLESQMSKLMQV